VENEMSNSPTTSPTTSERPLIRDCWNKIGVSGDVSCPELKEYIHCRNCPLYSAAAVELLDRDLPANYLGEWTRLVAQEKPEATGDTQSVVVFRIGAEWLALPTRVFKEIVGIRPVHSLPHRRNGVVLGLANIRGELLVCISLRQILRLDEIAESKKEKLPTANARMLFIQHEGLRAVCPVDEVFGIHRFRSRELMPVPATLAKATTYTKAVVSWRQGAVGLLDEDLLFYTLNRGLA
jgi:chemotaxis-related protein WspD